jgi:hypothetical protein
VRNENRNKREKFAGSVALDQMTPKIILESRIRFMNVINHECKKKFRVLCLQKSVNFL